MDIQELKLFRHLAATLHFGRTSQECNITPSGLTRTMQRLEQELGCSLFHRDRRSVRLTRSGELFKTYAEDALDRWVELQNSLAGDQILRGNLSLYCSVTAMLAILPEVFDQFRLAHPEVHIHLQTGDAAQAIFRLTSGDADLVIAARPDRLGDSLIFLELTETPLIFIAPAHYPAAIVYKDGEIDWRTTPIILSERGLSRDRSLQWFAGKGIQPNIYSQVAGNEAMIAMVGMGYGVAVVPKLVLDTSLLADQVTILDAKPELQPFSVGVCTSQKKLANPLVSAFLSLAKASKTGSIPHSNPEKPDDNDTAHQ